MSRTHGTLASLRLLGGSPCLDFANTVDPRQGDDDRYDYLQSYADLMQWSSRARLLDTELVDRLSRKAAEMPHGAEWVYRRAIALREAVYSVFSAVIAVAEPEPADLLVIEETHRESMPSVRLTWNGAGVGWQPIRDEPALELPLFLVSSSATELLANLSKHIVKRCPGAGDCGWLFLDRSKNHSRRWCSSNGCGARIKMRRRYASAGRRADPPPPSDGCSRGQGNVTTAALVDKRVERTTALWSQGA